MLCEDLDGWVRGEMGAREAQEGRYVHLQLMHVPI